MKLRPSRMLWVFALVFGCSFAAHAILAGGEVDLPADSPSSRLDTAGLFNFVGALEINTGSSRYYGSATALSPNWVLSAGHNVDFNDDGKADAGLNISFNLPGYGSYSASSYTINPDFSGFGNPSIHHDLSLLYFADPLPSLLFPTLGNSLTLDATATMIGYGRSGYGSYGYTTSASLTDRRFGFNVIDDFEISGSSILFRYDFDNPNTGGGVALNNEWGWISSTTGLAVPEPGTFLLFFCGLAVLFVTRRNRKNI